MRINFAFKPFPVNVDNMVSS